VIYITNWPVDFARPPLPSAVVPRRTQRCPFCRDGRL